LARKGVRCLHQSPPPPRRQIAKFDVQPSSNFADPPCSAASFEVNSEPHTGARPSVRLCVGLIKFQENFNEASFLMWFFYSFTANPNLIILVFNFIQSTSILGWRSVFFCALPHLVKPLTTICGFVYALCRLTKFLVVSRVH
jgi:hypothetical protein